MNVLETLRMAWEAIRANKVRSSLTLLGMVIGVFAIITSVTAVRVIEVYFEESINILGSSTFAVTRLPGIRINDSSARYRNRPNITYEQVQRLIRSLQAPVTVSVLEDFAGPHPLRYEDRETAEGDLFLLGTDEHFLGNYSYEIGQGRFLTAQDVHYGRSVGVIGAEIAEELFPNETPLGKLVTFDGRRIQIVGVLSEKGSLLGFSQDRRVLVPISYAFATYGGPQRNIANISFRAATMAQIPAAMDEVVSRMRVIRKVPPGDPNNFEVESNDQFKDFFDAFTGSLTIGGAGIGLIALLAAGIGIMNIMLVSVTERTREIGIRKSIGARRRDILRQFLLEAFFLCQLGGLVGIALGALVGNLVAVYFEISAAIPWDWAVGGVVLVTIIALVFGGYPAYTAAKLDPIESLRYE
ncbi:MAG: ABC transporter permease [Bacteroidota bacterium]